MEDGIMKKVRRNKRKSEKGSWREEEGLRVKRGGKKDMEEHSVTRNYSKEMKKWKKKNGKILKI